MPNQLAAALAAAASKPARRASGLRRASLGTVRLGSQAGNGMSRAQSDAASYQQLVAAARGEGIPDRDSHSVTVRRVNPMSLAALSPRISAASSAAIGKAQQDAANLALAQLAAVGEVIVQLAQANPSQPVAGVYRDAVHGLTSIAAVLSKLAGELAANTTQHVNGTLPGALGSPIPQIGPRGSVVARKPRVFQPTSYRVA